MFTTPRMQHKFQTHSSLHDSFGHVHARNTCLVQMAFERVCEQYCCSGKWIRSKHEVSHNSSSGACTQASRDAYSEKKRSESRQIHCTSSQSFARIGCLTTSKKDVTELIGTSDASLAYVRSAKSEGRLRNSCLIHPGSFCHWLHRFRLLSLKNLVSFCCVAEGRLSLLTPLAVAHFFGNKASMYIAQNVVRHPHRGFGQDPMAQRVAIQSLFPKLISFPALAYPLCASCFNVGQTRAFQNVVPNVKKSAATSL